MQVLSHRGYWQTAEEKNLSIAFRRSFEMGFGTETDLRDLAGALVVSHDPPVGACMSASEMAEIHRELGPDLTLALNVKADGLTDMTRDLLDAFSIRDAFVFDMSVPDALRWLSSGIPVFTRHSDEEMDPSFYDRAAGVWLDAFHSDWWGPDVVARHLDAGKRVCIVSPELHGRDHRPVWEMLRGSDISGHENALICTDYPEQAREFFDDH